MKERLLRGWSLAFAICAIGPTALRADTTAATTANALQAVSALHNVQIKALIITRSSSLSISSNANTVDVSKLLNGIQENTQFMIRRWTATSGVSKQFLNSVDYDQQVLNRAQNGTAAQRLRAIEFVAHDVSLKKANCAASATGLGADVQVSVNTKLKGNVVSGYDIYYNFSLDDGYSAPMEFGPESSPAVEPISSGSYVFWAQRGATIVSQKKQQDVSILPVQLDLAVSQ
jgi:hypothetical protein